MEGWKNCKLADLGDIVGGATPSTKEESFYGGDFAWITPRDLSSFHGRYIRHGERNITKEGLRNCSAQLMPTHSVLFTSRAPIGYVAIAANEVCTNQGFKSIIPNADTDYLFMYYLLLHNRKRIEKFGSGTTFKEISGSVMKEINVSVPIDIEEQRKIARILGSIDDKIEINTTINHHLEQMAQAIFKSWFVGFEQGILCTLGELLTLRDERDADPSLRIYSIGNEGIYPRDIKYHKNLSSPTTANKICYRYDIVFGMGSKGIITWGLVDVERCSVSPDYKVYSVINPESAVYLHFYLQYFRSSFSQILKPGSRMGQRIDPIKLSQISVHYPESQNLKRFYEFWLTYTEKYKNLREESAHLSKIRDYLLPRLMSGELSVADVDGK
jgi:type I restriction enzyme S subunit